MSAVTGSTSYVPTLLPRERYEELGQRIMEAFTRAFPEAPRTELYWRFKFVGVTTHIQADADRTGEYTADLSGVDEMVGRMVAFLAAGPFAGAAAAGSGEEGASL